MADERRIIPHIRHVLAMSEITHLGGIATLKKKQHHPLMAALAAVFKTPILSFSCSDLEAQTPFLTNPSEELYVRIGCHGVAEAAALAAAGKGGVLVIPKTICHKVTFAVASRQV